MRIVSAWRFAKCKKKDLFILLSSFFFFCRWGFVLEKVLEHVSLKMHAETETEIEFNFCPSTKWYVRSDRSATRQCVRHTKPNQTNPKPNQNHYGSIYEKLWSREIYLRMPTKITTLVGITWNGKVVCLNWRQWQLTNLQSAINAAKEKHIFQVFLYVFKAILIFNSIQAAPVNWQYCDTEFTARHVWHLISYRLFVMTLP